MHFYLNRTWLTLHETKQLNFYDVQNNKTTESNKHLSLKTLVHRELSIMRVLNHTLTTSINPSGVCQTPTGVKKKTKHGGRKLRAKPYLKLSRVGTQKSLKPEKVHIICISIEKQFKNLFPVKSFRVYVILVRCNVVFRYTNTLYYIPKIPTEPVVCYFLKRHTVKFWINCCL